MAKRPAQPRTARKGGTEVLTLRELLERAVDGPWRDVKSTASLLSNVKFLNERLGDTAVDAITVGVLENFVARMQEQGYKPGTIKRKLATLGRALTLAVRWGIIETRPPMPELTVRNIKDRVLSRDEEQKVYDAIRQRHAVEPWRGWDEFEELVTVLLHTAGRLSEVLTLSPASVVTVGGHPAVSFERYLTKSDKPRVVPLTATAKAALDRVIASGCPTRSAMWRITPVRAWSLWDTIRKDIGGLDDVTLHTLRHTALTRLAQGGMELRRLQEWAGHSDPRVTAQRYAHLQPTDLLGGLAILEGAST